jgi:DNA-binding NarL/FixJ family response regulator
MKTAAINPEPPVQRTTVWLIEDNEVFRTAVARLINRTEGLQCPQAFANFEDALAALSRGEAPRVMISDIGLPGMSGIEGISKVRDLSPDTQVIVLTVYDDHQKVYDAICAGASGYLLKNSIENTLQTAIRDVLNGGAPMSPRVARMVLDQFGRLASPPRKDYGLTDREKQTLELMSRGMIMKQIASELHISYHTVNNHLRAIYDKLHVHNRSSAVAKALTERLF